MHVLDVFSQRGVGLQGSSLPVDWLLQLSIKQRMRGDWLEWADLQVSYALREAGLGEGDQSPSVYISNHLKLVTDTNEKAKANEFNVLGFKPREHTLNRLQQVQLKSRHVRHINIAAVLRRVLDDIYLLRFLGRFAFLNSSIGGYFFCIIWSDCKNRGEEKDGGF